MVNQTVELIQGKITKVRLNRPDIHNALNDYVINELYNIFDLLDKTSETRVIVLTGNGASFCAGADLNWMKGVVNYSSDRNYDESKKLADLLYLIYTNSKPVIARVNGPAIGGGAGLMAACDIVISVDNAKFAFSEVSLGLVPAVISPFVVRRIGERAARELFITARRVDAHEAKSIGLVDFICQSDELDDKVDDVCRMIVKNASGAIRTVKELMTDLHRLQFPDLGEHTAKMIASLRAGKEGQEGMNAFINKRKPGWMED
jgi:methylglutaconyl-CoA hydratase